MRTLITGAAGSGTSTLAKALAERWCAVAIEVDALFWVPTDPPFKVKRDPEQRCALLVQQIRQHERVVVAGSVAGWGVDSLFDLVVFLYVDAAVRIRRLQEREVLRFGTADPVFLQWAAQYDEGPLEGRSFAKHEAWLRALSCPVLRLEGVKSVAEHVARVVEAVPNPSLNTGRATA